jgi:class 3 adenylate cyclase/tetratricopeptide (TPR) repeat protein
MLIGPPTSVNLLPRIVRDRLVRPGPRVLTAHATLVLVDLADSTAQAHTLAQQGREGVDRLNTTLNGALGRLTDVVSAHGGDVLRFLGDALLAAWWGATPEQPHRAGQCALALQSALEGAGPGEWQARVRVVVATGPVEVLALGGERGRWEVAYDGDVVRTLWRLLAGAPIGRVYVARDTWPRLPGAQGTPDTFGHLLDRLAPIAPVPASTEPAAPWESVAPFLPAALRYRLGAGPHEWTSELRRVTTVFLRLSDPPHGGAAWRQRAVVALQHAVYRHEGSLEKLSFDATGLVALVVYGLPPLAHEDDARRALCTCLELRDLRVDDIPVFRGAGIGTGEVFCGLVGGSTRSEYSIIGDSTNVAARLLCADDRIRCDAATIEATGSRFRTSAPVLTPLRGKAKDILVYEALGERSSVLGVQSPLVGRAEELAVLVEERSRVEQSGDARLIVVTGDPGLGKTHLIERFLADEAERGLGAAIAQCESSTQSIGHRPWRQLLGALAGGAGIVHQLPVLYRQTREDAARMQLLGRALSGEQPERSSLATADRTAEAILDLLERLLQARGDRGVTILAIEDAHWMDSASWAVAVRLAEARLPVLLVMTARPVELPKRLNARVLPLGPLPASDLERIASECLGVTAPPALEALLRDRADGNPLFAQAITWSLRDSGALLVEDGVCRLTSRAATAVPTTIKDVFLARTDRLPPHLALTIRVASVLGRGFTHDALVALHPRATDVDLADLVAAGLLADRGSGQYTFTHAFAQTAIYETLLASQRQTLHEAAARWYEHAGTPDDDAVLGRHWAGAQVPRKAADYLGRAGAETLTTGAFHEAVDLLVEALAWDARAATPSDARAGWERALGEAWYGLARLRDARASLEGALRQRLVHVPRSAAGFLFAAGWAALRQAWHLLRPPRPTDTSQAALEVALATERLAQVYYMENLTFPALWSTLVGLNVAERGPPSPELARACANTAVAAGAIGLDAQALRYLTRADAIATATRSPSAAACVAADRGIFHYGKGRFDESEHELRRGRVIAAEMADSRRLEELTVNLGGLLDRRGQCAEAHTFWAEMLTSARRAGNLQVEVWALSGRVTQELFARGESPSAEDLSGALLAGRDILAAVDLLWAKGLLLKLHLARGDVARAEAVAERLRKRMTPLTIGHYTLDAHEGLAELAVAHARGGRGLREARDAVAALDRFARALPMGKPAACRYRGWLAVLEGQPDAAMHAWQEGAAFAEKIGYWTQAVHIAEDALAEGGGEAWRTRATAARARLSFPEGLVPVVHPGARAFASDTGAPVGDGKYPLARRT